MEIKEKTIANFGEQWAESPENEALAPPLIQLLPVFPCSRERSMLAGACCFIPMP